MRKDEIHSGGKLQSVLFVCTGNIFRSVTAEYALKTHLGSDTSHVISSAGIEAKPQLMHAWVLTRLREKGADLSRHVPRQLTKEVVDCADLVIAMGRNHQTFIREQFGRNVPLFNQVCLNHDQPILDLHEVIPNWGTDPDQAHAYVCSVIDIIWATVPALLAHLR
jgi:protein-tyrosine phosphatase